MNKLSLGHSAWIRPLSWASALWLGLVLLVLGWVAVKVGLHTAYWFQSFDEPLKGEQVWRGEYKLNHPPMMVALAHLLGSWTGKLESEGDGVFWAREVVAFFGAVGMAALGTVAARRRGMLVALLSFGLILCLSFFQHNVRIAKEEPLLFAGFALFVLAVAWREDKRSGWAAAGLGLSAALAFSTKYVGLLVVPLSLLALLLLPALDEQGRGGKRWRDLGCWLLALVFGALIFLAPAWLNWEKSVKALEGEFAHMTEVKDGDKEDVAWLNPRGARQFWSRLGGTGHLGLLLFGVGVALVFWRQKLPWARASGEEEDKVRTKISFTEVFLLGLALLFPLVVMFSNFYSDRYQLAPRALATYFLALGFCWLLQLALRQFAQCKGIGWQAHRATGLLIFLLVFAGDQLRRGVEVYRDVTTNHRQEFVNWAEVNLPADAVLLTDQFGRFPTPDDHRLREAEPLLAQPVRYLGKDPAKLKAKEVREAGITHLLLTERGLGKFYKHLARKEEAKLSESQGRRLRFYQAVLKQERLWEQRFSGKHHLYSSELFLVELPPEALLELKK